MNTTRLSSPAALALVIAAFIGGAMFISTATQGNPARLFMVPESEVIAVVRLDAVVDGLQEREGKQQTYEQQRDLFRKVIEGLEMEIQEMVDRLEIATESSKAEIMIQIRRLREQRQFELQYSDAMLAELQSEMLRQLFKKIDAAVDVIAQRNGYTLVLSSDEGVLISPGSYADVTRAIAVRRILHVNPEHDITDEVTSYMNNQFVAGTMPVQQ